VLKPNKGSLFFSGTAGGFFLEKKKIVLISCGFDKCALVAYILQVTEIIIIFHLEVCRCYDYLSIVLHILIMLHGALAIATVRSRERKVSLWIYNVCKAVAQCTAIV
jgi:hypothetical protein